MNELILELFNKENLVEQAQERLILRCHQFTTRMAYKYLFGCENSVRVDSLSRALQNIGVSASETDIRLMLERFDTNSDGQLTYTDVCDFFTP